MTLSVRMLGPVEARHDGDPIPLGGPKTRGVLAMLALNAGRVVSIERLVAGLWGPDPADGTTASLQVHISNLRKRLAPSGAAVIVTRSPGYYLDAEHVRVDALEFEQQLNHAHLSRRHGELDTARQTLTEALSTWRGAPLDDLAALPFAGSARSWMTELKASAQSALVDLRLEAGEHADMIVMLESLVEEQPLRERSWEQLMTALYRSGRQADALHAYQRARRVLLDDLGIEPGQGLQTLEAAVLRQSPHLDLRSSTEPLTRPVDRADPGTTLRGGAPRMWLHLDQDSEWPIDDVVTVGRHPECDILLDDPSVSRRHVEIRRTGLGGILRDLDSANGTTVNDATALQCVLVDGDRVRVGSTELVFRRE